MPHSGTCRQQAAHASRHFKSRASNSTLIVCTDVVSRHGGSSQKGEGGGGGGGRGEERGRMLLTMGPDVGIDATMSLCASRAAGLSS